MKDDIETLIDGKKLSFKLHLYSKMMTIRRVLHRKIRKERFYTMHINKRTFQMTKRRLLNHQFYFTQ